MEDNNNDQDYQATTAIMAVAAAKPSDGAAFTAEFAGVLRTFDDLAQAHADTAKRSNDTLALDTARQADKVEGVLRTELGDRA